MTITLNPLSILNTK